jgi:hypothetical protein
MVSRKIDQKLNKAGKEAIAHFTSGDEQRVLLLGLKRFTKMDALNTIALRRDIADYRFAENKFPFNF